MGDWGLGRDKRKKSGVVARTEARMHAHRGDKERGRGRCGGRPGMTTPVDFGLARRTATTPQARRGHAEEACIALSGTLALQKVLSPASRAAIASFQGIRLTAGLLSQPRCCFPIKGYPITVACTSIYSDVKFVSRCQRLPKCSHPHPLQLSASTKQIKT